MSKRISYKVNGRVQGVCFRAYTVENANEIGVTGFVKNASDGTVIGEAQGDGAQIQKFVQWLNKGPSAAKVCGVEQSEIDLKQGESGFKQ
ncbi:acylphosphatase family protein [Neofusicoccum parvum]|uniref:Acylphosphatase n=2 Tax=Neofusicoccum parvum TaxID=310453 RepID=R1EEJ9_BOTPV|nr:putative acylphosphatase family protein [Neofusicoccum parvum UCRNP2]GME24266.1 acylphosphatase family protein [Neofusicoccum parvum]GME41168.1 acylphosphatase family protein [Neofusicoccum parvum]